QAQRAEAERQRDRAREGFGKAREAVELMLTRVAGKQLAHVPQMEPVRRQLLEDALKFHQGFLQEKGDDPEVRMEAAQSYRYVGDILQELNRPAEADKSYRRGIELQEALVREYPDRVEYARRLAASYNNLGALVRNRGDSEKAEESF